MSSQTHSQPSSEPTLFDPRPGRTRRDDWVTSIAGAESVAYRAGSQKARLLAAYEEYYPMPLTDDEAARHAGLPITSCYWKRCGELRQDGAIVVVTTAKSDVSGEQRIACTYNPEMRK